MIVVFGGEKGGTGKSTLAVNIATIAAAKKKSVLLFDTDLQTTVSFWVRFRNEAGIKPEIPIIQKHGQTIHEDLEKISGQYDFIVVDAGGRDSPESRAAMIAADKLYLPMRPSQYDAWTLDKAETIIEEAMEINPKLKTYALVNLANPNPAVSEADEFKLFLKQFKNIRICKTVIHERIVFRKSSSEGMAVTEWKPEDPKASMEMINLHKEIIRR